ncbi:hypothetical protein BGW39_007394 [Mortierella sp. 14UC]|nr:hypothetical protein BGW39_007394 [Mortierella sp. 14UC]
MTLAAYHKRVFRSLAAVYRWFPAVSIFGQGTKEFFYNHAEDKVLKEIMFKKSWILRKLTFHGFFTSSQGQGYKSLEVTPPPTSKTRVRKLSIQRKHWRHPKGLKIAGVDPVQVPVKVPVPVGWRQIYGGGHDDSQAFRDVNRAAEQGATLDVDSQLLNHLLDTPCLLEVVVCETIYQKTWD